MYNFFSKVYFFNVFFFLLYFQVYITKKHVRVNIDESDCTFSFLDVESKTYIFAVKFHWIFFDRLLTARHISLWITLVVLDRDVNYKSQPLIRYLLVNWKLYCGIAVIDRDCLRSSYLEYIPLKLITIIKWLMFLIPPKCFKCWD